MMEMKKKNIINSLMMNESYCVPSDFSENYIARKILIVTRQNPILFVRSM